MGINGKSELISFSMRIRNGILFVTLVTLLFSYIGENKETNYIFNLKFKNSNKCSIGKAEENAGICDFDI